MEEDVRELRLAEQALARQSLEAKSERVRELETEVRYLRGLLNEAFAARNLSPQPAARLAPRTDLVPRRWRLG